MIKVVIADDEEKVCQLICSLVDWRALGMEIVAVAHDGVKALEQVTTHSPHLLITDIRMPGYDGLELIARARAAREDLEIVIISGHRHFEYARTAIRYGVGEYLLKPINQKELLQTLEKIAQRHLRKMEELTDEGQLKIRRQSDLEKLRDGLFTQLLLKEAGIQSLYYINEAYHYSFQEGSFQAVILKLDGEEGYHRGIELFQNKAVTALSSLREERWDMGLYCEDSFVYCVLNMSPESSKAMRKKLRLFLEEMLMQKSIFEKISVTLCCGDVVDSIQQLPHSMCQAKAAVWERLVEGTDRFIDQVEPLARLDAAAVANLGAQLNRELDEAIELLDVEKAATKVEFLLETVGTTAWIGGQDLYRLVCESCNAFLVLLQNRGYLSGDREAIYEEFCQSASYRGSAQQLVACLRELLERMLGAVVEDRRQAESKPVRQVKQYIRQHYNTPISLEEAGKMAGFSAAYFSSLFKKETGQNFLEYLTGVRMDKAKELLRETDRSISAVCQDVGYSDLKHFTKSFKKYTGLKPNEYRKLYA